MERSSKILVINQMRLGRFIKVIAAMLSLLIGAKVWAQNPFLKYTPDTLATIKTFHPSQEVLTVPKGSTQPYIPEFPGFTKIRIAAFTLNINLFSGEGRTEVANKLAKEKIPQIMTQLKAEGLLAEAELVAKKLGIDPLHVIGPIIGEFVFNGYIDQALQNIKLKNSLQKSQQQGQVHQDIVTMSQRMTEITASVESQECLSSSIPNYWKWRCILFFSPRLGRNTNHDLMRGFYSLTPDKNGRTISYGTFGIGQVQPYLLWSVNDIVHKKLGYKKYDVVDLETPFNIIFDNKQMIAYIGAISYNAIQVYKLIGGVDISKNPGLVVTLYNLGDEFIRAYDYAEKRKLSTEIVYPEVNYMGWFTNTYENEIRRYLKN